MVLEVKNPPASAGDRDMGWIPGSGKSPGEGHGNPLQYSCLENPMDGEAWQVTVQPLPLGLTDDFLDSIFSTWKSWAQTGHYLVLSPAYLIFPLSSEHWHWPVWPGLPFKLETCSMQDFLSSIIKRFKVSTGQPRFLFCFFVWGPGHRAAKRRKGCNQVSHFPIPPFIQINFSQNI